MIFNVGARDFARLQNPGVQETQQYLFLLQEEARVSKIKPYETF